MSKPTVFNYQDFRKLKEEYGRVMEENERLRHRSGNLEIRSRIAEADIERFRWTDAKDRDPDREGYYLVTMSGDIVGENESFTSICGFYLGTWDEAGVCAWMPIPDPYREGKR